MYIYPSNKGALVNPKGNQSWIFTGRTDAEAEAPVLWPPVANSWLIGKDPDAGKDWGQEEKRTTGDQMVGWHHWFACSSEFGQGSLACCSPWSRKESDTGEWLKTVCLFVVAVINASPHSRSMWAGTRVCEWLLVPSEHLMCVYIINEGFVT